MTGLACAIYWRKELFRSVKNFLFIGLAPLIGAGMLTYLLVESARQLADPGDSYSGDAIFGLGIPLVIAIFFTGLGLIVMMIRRFQGGEATAFFKDRSAFEAVPHEVAVGGGKVEAIGVAEEDV